MQLEKRGLLTLALIGAQERAGDGADRYELQRCTPVEQPFNIRFSRFICIRPEQGVLS